MALAALHAGEAVLWYLLLGALAGTASQVLARRRVRLDRVTAADADLTHLRHRCPLPAENQHRISAYLSQDEGARGV